MQPYTKRDTKTPLVSSFHHRCAIPATGRGAPTLRRAHALSANPFGRLVICSLHQPTAIDSHSFSYNNVRPRMSSKGHDKTISSSSKGLLCFPSLSVLLPPHIPRHSLRYLGCQAMNPEPPLFLCATLGVLDTALWPLYWILFPLSSECSSESTKSSFI